MNTGLEDRLQIADLVSSIGRCIDEHDYDGLRDLFTLDATVSTPGGTASGLDALVEQARVRHSAFAATQHLITNVLVDLEGDRATARANLQVSLAQSAPPDPLPYQAGAVYRLELARSAAGWRFTALATEQVWSLNAPAA